VISRNWLFGLLFVFTTLGIGSVLYKIVRERYDKIKQLVKSKEKEIELLTDLWKIDESEIEWLEHVSQGIFIFIFSP